MSKQRLVFLVRNMRKDDYGGAESYQIALAKELAKNNYRAIIVSSSDVLRKEAQKNHIETLRGPYCRLQNWSGWRNILLPFFAVWEVYLFVWYVVKILRFRPDILHIQSRDDMIGATLAAKITKRKCFWTDHTDFRFVVWENLNQRFKNPIGKFIYKIAPKVNKITTISQYEHDHVISDLGVRLDNFVVIHNGVTDCLTSTKTKFDYTVGYVGRLIDYKGIFELIDAFNIVSEKQPKARLLLYGTGEDAFVSDCKRRAKSNPAIKFCGFTDRPMEALSKIDIFVLPSYHEGLSMSLLEATMMQKIIIASDVDGNPEVIENRKNGLLVPAKDSCALAEALEYALDYKKSKAFAAEARRTYEEKFNFADIVKEQIVKMYES